MKRIQLLITLLVSVLLLTNSVNVKASANEKSAVLKIKSNILPLANITKIVNENSNNKFAATFFAAVATVSQTFTTFSACQSSTTSTQTFTVSATGLAANLLITAPTGYEVSLAVGAGTFSTSISLTQSGGIVSTTTLWIRLKNGLPSGFYLGNLVVSSAGTSLQSVPVPANSGIGPVPPPATITASGATSFCAPGSVVLTAPSGPYSYTWSTGANTASITATTSGSYTLTVSYSCGTATSSATIVTATALPTVNAITGTLSVCIGGSSTLSNTTTGGTWTSGTTGVATISSAGLVSGVAAGSSTITYTVASNVNSACTNFTTASVLVNSLPTLSVGNIGGVLTTATSYDIPLTATTGSPDLYSVLASTPALSSYTAVNDGTLSGTTITVPLPTTKTAGSYGFNLRVKKSTTGCESAARALSLSVTKILTSGTISAFTTCIGTASASQTFTVTGSGLIDDILLTAPTGIEISRTSSTSGYKDTLILAQSSASVAATTIYLRLKASATANSGTTWNSNTISLTAASATTATISIPASIISTLPAISATLSKFYTNVGANLTLTGSASPAISNTWVSSVTSIGTISSSSVTGVFVPVANGSTDVTYTNSNGCSVVQSITVGPNVPVMNSVTAGQTKNYLRWTVPTTPLAFVDSIQIHRSTDSLGTFAKIATIFNDTTLNTNTSTSRGKPLTTSAYTYFGTYNGSDYYLSNNATTWTAAKAAAIAEGGQLVCIETAAENNYLTVRNYALYNGHYWAGGYQINNLDEAKGNWYWVNGKKMTMDMTGTSFGYNSGEPNNSPAGEDYLEILNGGNWNDLTNNNGLRYLIEYDGSTSLNLSNFTDSSLTNNTRYYYKLKSKVKSSGDISGFGNIKGGTPNTGTKIPSAITASTVSNIVQIKWTNESTEAGTYQIERSVDSFKITSNLVGNIANTKTSILDSNLSNRIYYYRIKAIDANGVESSYSNIIASPLVVNKIYVASTGSDANLGSYSSPLKTLTKALVNSFSGDTIILAKGTYANSATLKVVNQVYITSNYYTTKDSSDITGTIITGGKDFQLFTGSPTFTINGLTIQDHSNLVFNASSFISIYACIIKNNGDPSNINNTFMYLRNSSILNSSRIESNYGIVTLEGYGNKVDQNFFYKNKYSVQNGATQLINGWKGKTYITNNIFVQNGYDFTNYWDGFRSAVIEPGGWGGDSTFIINNTFIKNGGLAIHVSLSNDRTMIIANNLIYNPAGDIMFYKPSNGNTSYNKSTIFSNNTLLDSLSKYTSNGYYNVTETGNIYGQDISKMFDTTTNKLKSNFVGIKQGVYSLLNKSSTSYYKVPLYDYFNNARTTKIDIGAEQVTYNLASPILDNVEGGDNFTKISILKPYDTAKIKAFEIYRDVKSIADSNTVLKPILTTANNNVLSILDTNVTNGLNYYYRIKALEAANPLNKSLYSNEVSVKPNIPPSRIDTLLISSAPRSALLTWKKLNSPVKYLVLGGKTKEELSVVANNLDTNNYKLTNLLPNTNYWFAVKAVDSGGAVSKISNIVQLKLSNTWYVDTLLNSFQIGSNEYPLNSLQSTIDNSLNGDTILVKPGQYSSIKVSNKSIFIKSLAGATSTSIVDLNKVGYLVRIDGNSSGTKPYPVTIVSGFNISDFQYYQNIPYASGVIYSLEYTSPVFENCVIQNNKWRALIGTDYAAPTFVNCIISNNETLFSIPYNDSTQLNYRTVRFVNSNIINNTNWGYINTYNNRGLMPFLNCIIWGNGRSTMLKDGTTPNHKVVNSIVDDKIYAAQSGNIKKDPLYNDVSSGSYQLSNSSPAIGKGAPYLLMNGDTLFAATKDFEYNTRPLPAGSSIDIGAYENKNYFAAPKLLELNRDVADKKNLTISFSYDSTLSLSKYLLIRDTLKAALDTALTYRELAKTTSMIYDTIALDKTYYYALRLVTTDNKKSGISNIKSSNDTINVPSVNFLNDTASLIFNNASGRLKFNLVNLSSDPENNKNPHLIFYDDSYRLVDTNQSRVDYYDTMYILNSSKGSGTNTLKHSVNARIKINSKPDYYQKILPPFNVNFDDEFDLPIIRMQNGLSEYDQKTELMTLKGKISNSTWSYDHDSTTNYYGAFKSSYNGIVKNEIPSNLFTTPKFSYMIGSHEMPNIREDADYIDADFNGTQEFVVTPSQLKWSGNYLSNGASYQNVNATLKLIKFIDVNNDGIKDIFATTNWGNWLGLGQGSPLMVFVSNKKVGAYELNYTNVALDYNTSIYIGPLKNYNDGVFVIARTNGSSAYNTFKFNTSNNRLVVTPNDYKLKVNLSDGRFDVADINSDGFPDIAQFGNSGAIQIYLNNQIDGFKDVAEFDNPFTQDIQGNGYPINFRLLDLNNDGFKDIVWTEYARNNNTYGTARVLRSLVQTPNKSFTIPTLTAPKNLTAANNGYLIKTKWDRVLNQASNSINTYNFKISNDNTYKTSNINTFYNYRATNPKIPIVLDGMKFGSYIDSVVFKDNTVSSSKPYYLTVQTVNPDGIVSDVTQLSFTPKDVLTKSLKNVLPGLTNARMAWGDYNNDGLLDLAVMGSKDDGTSFTTIYKNDKGTLVDLGLTNISLLNGDLKWADINNDGWLDLLVVGQYSTSKNKVQLFTNRRGFFEITAPTSIPALRNSTITFGDQDANGTMDLAMIGADSVGNPRSYLLNNDGAGNFTIDKYFFDNQIIPNICNGDIRFVDFDLDGDLDLVYAGSDKLDQSTARGVGGIKVNTLLDAKNSINYINNFTTTYVQGLNLANAKFDFGDVDNDGDMDIVIIGTNQDGGTNTVPVPLVKLIKNRTVETRGGANNFYYNYYNTQESILDSVDKGSVKFSDYNNDGLLDLAYTGTNKKGSPTTKILMNLGGFNNFDTVRNVALPQYSSSTLAWGDFDNSGTQDLLVAGENKGVSALTIFTNEQGDNKNIAPKLATNLVVNDFGLGRVLLSWTPPEDDHTTSNSLYYLIRVGTTPGGSNIVTIPVNKINGKYKLLSPNTTLISGNSYYMELMPGKYYWSVMSIDNNFESSDYSAESNFTLSYPWKFVNQGGLVDRRIQPVDNPAFAWADFNNDGKSDFIYLGTQQWNQSLYWNGPIGIYQNLANKFAKVTSTGLENIVPSLKNVEVKCVDINADGLIDILIAGENPTDFNSSPTFLVFQNQGNFIFTDITTKFIKNFSGFKKLKNPKIEFSDFDNDGYLDMVYGGTQTDGTGAVNIYKISKDTLIKTVPNYAFVVTAMPNNLSGIINANDPQNIQFAFGDLNKDKTFDLVTTYEGGGFTRYTDIYINNFDSATQSSKFTKYTSVQLPKIKNGKIDLVDFNNDGLLDIAMSGYATGIGEIFNVYQNTYTKANGLNFVNVTTAGLQPVENTKTTWGDFNGDGFPDVIFSGDRDGYGYVTKMAISSKDTVGYSQFNELPTFPFGNYTKLTPSMGDIGGDGHLGFVLVGSENDPLYQGQNSQLYKSFRILRNVRNYSAVVSGNAVAAETSTGRIKSMSLAANKTSTVFNNIKPLNISSLLVKPYASDSTQLDSGLLESSYLSNDAPTIPVLYKLNVAKKRAENKYLVQFNWKPSTDDKTPSDGLTYSLSVGTASNLSDIVNVESDLATGIQKKPQPGNVGKDTSWQISLPPGKYYYSVQSIDAAYEGSKFSDRQMFTLSSLGVTKEVTPPSDILFNDSARAKFYFRKGDSTNFNVKLRAISKDTTSKYTISLVTGSGTNAIFSFNSTTNVLTLKGKLTDTLYMLTVKAADSLGSELVKSYSIYVRQSADKILLNSVDTSIIRYKTGVDSAGLATGLLAAYNTVTSNASTNFTYKLVAGAGDFNNGSFSIENDVLVNTKKLTSADTLSVRVTALDDYGLNTDKIIKFVSNCTTKPNLIVSTSTAAICSPGTINIADTVYRKGSTGAFAISYFADQNEQTLVADPTKVAKTGTYYIKAIDSNSCSVLKPLAVAVNALPIAPIASPIALCTNTPSSITTVVASAKSSLNWYGTAATGGTAVKTAPVPSVTAAGVTNYYVSQTDSASGCEGPRAKLAITVINTPVIARDTAGFLIANAVAGNKWYWYKDATLVDSSAKFKPTGAGSYTVKSMENACKSQSYYYLVTDVINLSATEYIKLAPNPFVNFLNFDFVVNGYQKLNIDVFETSTGSRISSKQGVYAGSRLSYSELSAGVYIFKVSSSDGKLSYQFKMIKL